MLERVLAAGIPAKWVTGDTVYGNDWRMRCWLNERRQAYVLAVSQQYRIFTGERRQWTKQVIAELPQESWRIESCGAGSEGERLYEWAGMMIRRGGDGWQRWPLARRSLSDPNEVSYYIGCRVPQKVCGE